MNHLTGQMVVVVTQETEYTGRLVEIGEEEVYLQTESGWMVIPVERIALIRLKER